jgi:hypothetical protein
MTAAMCLLKGAGGRKTEHRQGHCGGWIVDGPIEDRKGIGGRFVVRKVEGEVGDLVFEAVASDGRSLGRQRLSGSAEPLRN